MRARKAKPGLTKTREQGHSISAPQAAILADEIFVRPSMGAVLPQPGHHTPRSPVKCPGLGIPPDALKTRVPEVGGPITVGSLMLSGFLFRVSRP